jgi:hypothetical protein
LDRDRGRRFDAIIGGRGVANNLCRRLSRRDVIEPARVGPDGTRLVTKIQVNGERRYVIMAASEALEAASSGTGLRRPRLELANLSWNPLRLASAMSFSERVNNM